MNDRPKMLDWITKQGVQVYADWEGEGRGWMHLSAQCPQCDHRWQAVAAVGSLGIECPVCGHCDLMAVWEESEDDENP